MGKAGKAARRRQADQARSASELLEQNRKAQLGVGARTQAQSLIAPASTHANHQLNIDEVSRLSAVLNHMPVVIIAPVGYLDNNPVNKRQIAEAIDLLIAELKRAGRIVLSRPYVVASQQVTFEDRVNEGLGVMRSRGIRGIQIDLRPDVPKPQMDLVVANGFVDAAFLLDVHRGEAPVPEQRMSAYTAALLLK